MATLAFCFSLSIELVQLIIRETLGSGRSTDINDILANTAGAVFGFLIVKKLFKLSLLRNLLQRFQLQLK
ncbi:VanZ family protein [Gracilibacillus boraciitolerans]|uniref:VanZ family protein n=1 Tax=Gracilibacillus boraciitolerans TaxID=307521 RepID=UPI001F268E51|nr:VanZ family protein [Gracilibacillus boraciitolerans]